MKNYQTNEQLAILRYNQLKTKRERNGMKTASLNVNILFPALTVV